MKGEGISPPPRASRWRSVMVLSCFPRAKPTPDIAKMSSLLHSRAPVLCPQAPAAPRPRARGSMEGPPHGSGWRRVAVAGGEGPAPEVGGLFPRVWESCSALGCHLDGWWDRVGSGGGRGAWSPLAHRPVMGRSGRRSCGRGRGGDSAASGLCGAGTRGPGGR